MTPTFQISFKNPDNYRKVRNYLEELHDGGAGIQWRYGQDNGTSYIHFFKGTLPSVYVMLGEFIQENGITYS